MERGLRVVRLPERKQAVKSQETVTPKKKVASTLLAPFQVAPFPPWFLESDSFSLGTPVAASTPKRSFTPPPGHDDWSPLGTPVAASTPQRFIDDSFSLGTPVAASTPRPIPDDSISLGTPVAASTPRLVPDDSFSLGTPVAASTPRRLHEAVRRDNYPSPSPDRKLHTHREAIRAHFTALRQCPPSLDVKPLRSFDESPVPKPGFGWKSLACAAVAAATVTAGLAYAWFSG
jgi:hypothetical protein